MNILVFGPSGAGKTYVSGELRKMGIDAIDTDTIEGLSSWFKAGEKVIPGGEMDKEFLDNHAFLWDKDFLKDYLNQKSDIYLFGAAGNLFDCLDLFDKVFFLKIDPETQKERLKHESRENPMGDTEYQRENAVKYGEWLENEAKKRNVPFIDATLSPREILEIIKN